MFPLLNGFLQLAAHNSLETVGDSGLLSKTWHPAILSAANSNQVTWCIQFGDTTNQLINPHQTECKTDPQNIATFIGPTKQAVFCFAFSHNYSKMYHLCQE